MWQEASPTERPRQRKGTWYNIPRVIRALSATCPNLPVMHFRQHAQTCPCRQAGGPPLFLRKPASYNQFPLPSFRMIGKLRLLVHEACSMATCWSNTEDRVRKNQYDSRRKISVLSFFLDLRRKISYLHFFLRTSGQCDDEQTWDRECGREWQRQKSLNNLN